MKVGVIAYTGGNVRSIRSALEELGAEVVYSDQLRMLRECAGLVFPGVGAALPAVHDLRSRGIWDWLPQWDRPFLGICLGMQLLGRETEEGPAPGLGIFPLHIQLFRAAVRLPHIGWNLVRWTQKDPLQEGLPESFYAYFVHSYRAEIGEYTIGMSEYGEAFSSVVRNGLFWGTQFHPEKSGNEGMQLLRNFLKLCKS
ncbi:MAG: imidazole glycerol phosphate synthase subunit HisH [Bacteroidia bacterium]|nr:imidazole glycerol phosphate synthase subunit HisH [Bacteroidia bacterium]